LPAIKIQDVLAKATLTSYLYFAIIILPT